MKKWKKRIVRIFLVLALAVGALAGLAVWRVTRWPATSGTLASAGLDGPIEILRGPYGVPHVLAQSPRDAYFGLGFCEAQDRTVQLEIFRRAASGRLAEILGEGVLPMDRFARTVGIRRIAERQMANASPEAQALASAFCDGVNAGFRSLEWRPPELLLLGIEPEPWEPVDIVAIARLVSWGLAGDAKTELLFARIAEKIGPERAQALLPLATRSAHDDQALAPPRPLPPGLDAEVLAGGTALVDALGLAPGCSNWIIGGARTKTGKPLFAYDSHQGGARIPGEVYLAHLVGGPRLDVMGGMIVGLPGVYSGATREIAFGSTNLMGDAQDLVVLDVDPARPGEYEACGERRPFTIREEKIAVKGRKEPLALTVRETVFGPVVSELWKAAAGGKCLAVRWAGARPELRMDGFVSMPLARSWPEFRACLDAFEASPQHFGFAAADGTIVYQVIGPLWRRSEPPPAWPDRPARVEEPALLTLDELPHLVNPPDCFVVTANHRPVGGPFWLGREFVPAARHDRIQELIAGREKCSIEDLQTIGLDDRSLFAARTAPVFAAVLKDARLYDAKWLGERLAAWDHRMRGDAIEPLLYHALWDYFARALLEDELGPELLREYASQAQVSQERLAAILEDPASPFWDDVRTAEHVETRQEIVERAASAALVNLELRLGHDRATWRWDRLHTVTFASYLHDASTLLDVGPFPVSGDADTPYRFGETPTGEPFRVDMVALLRLFVDLGDPSAIYAVVSTGESGWPFHPHAKDQIPSWLEGRAIRFPREIAEIRATCKERILIEKEDGR